MTTQAIQPPHLFAEDSDTALENLLRLLDRRGYRFITPTPATHERILGRPWRAVAADLRDVLGWSLPFQEELLDAELTAALLASGGLDRGEDGLLRARYRVSSLGDDLFLHSAFPTDAEDSVFFGPDSYRFADLVRRELTACPPKPGARLVDIGAGAGVGAIAAARACPDLRLTMTDINPAALRLARVNAGAAGIEAEYIRAGSLAVVADPIDVALANPPYVIDAAGRYYRDGGGHHGAEAAYGMASEAVARLAPGGRLILYTGSAIVAGDDWLHSTLSSLAERAGCTLRYREIDSDVFGEELEKPPYRDVERIALIAAVIAR